jgi:hypothetical protein
LALEAKKLFIRWAFMDIKERPGETCGPAARAAYESGSHDAFPPVFIRCLSLFATSPDLEPPRKATEKGNVVASTIGLTAR